MAALALAQIPPHLKAPRAYHIVMPLRGISRDVVRAAVASSTTIPIWEYSVIRR
ncbi:MAG: hypothetical protein ACREQR_04845 [Candidatus Binataceae bacterium]